MLIKEVAILVIIVLWAIVGGYMIWENITEKLYARKVQKENQERQKKINAHLAETRYVKH